MLIKNVGVEIGVLVCETTWHGLLAPVVARNNFLDEGCPRRLVKHTSLDLTADVITLELGDCVRGLLLVNPRGHTPELLTARQVTKKRQSFLESHRLAAVVTKG